MDIQVSRKKLELVKIAKQKKRSASTFMKNMFVHNVPRVHAESVAVKGQVSKISEAKRQSQALEVMESFCFDLEPWDQI